MYIAPISFTPLPHATDNSHDAPTSGTRTTRSLDTKAPKDQQLVQEVQPEPASQGGGYGQVTVDPDPGKSVANSQKEPVPVNLGPNINVDPVAKEISKAFKSVEQEASDFLKEKFAQMKAQETDPAKKQKWDVDPDNTYLVTYEYNSQGKEPFPAKITQKISLTQALIQNAQDTPTGEGFSVQFFEGGPNVKVQDNLKAHKPGVFDFSSRFNPHSQKSNITHSYQGIYSAPPDSRAEEYNASNQSSIDPEAFKKIIWKADYQKPYTEFLDQFWSSHQDKYPVLAKAACVKSAMAQHQEGSLSAEGKELVMRAAGLPGNQESWSDIKYEELQKNPPRDPNIEVGLVKIGDYQSTDLIYITDNTVKRDANGNKLPPLTLLYIPGNSSPIHSFNGPAEMKSWLAAQMADPLKRNGMASHFALKDKPNGWERAGIDETLAGLGAWPEKRETPGGLFSYDHRAFSGKWDPQVFITTEPNNLPFDEVAKRQKDRSYADAAVKITSDRDVTKTNILKGLEKAAKVALFLTPMALVVPEVALALDVFYLASGAVTTGIGIDDQKHGKPSGTDRIVFGLFNATTAVVPRISARAGEGLETATVEKAHSAPRSPVGNRTDGSWSEWFGFGETPVDPQLNDKFRVKMDNTRYGPETADYHVGYTQGDPKNIKGYSTSMTSTEIKKLALEPERTAEEWGTLVRTLEKRRATKSLESFLIFKRETEAAGGSVRGMPQDFYLSNVDVLTAGECAAMSSTMALAIKQGKEDIFIDNLFKAAAGSDNPKAAAFRDELSKLHDSIAYDFHGGQPVRRMTHKTIIAELANSPQSITLKISDNGHGIIAGVRIENNNKLFYLYDPNFGLAKFPSKEAMEKGLERLLNSGPVATTFKPVGYESSMPVFDVSTFTDTDFYMRSGRINPNKLLVPI
jgi:hypothetical protein